LRGSGYEITDEVVGAMQAERGAAGFVAIVAALLAATFSGTGSGDDAREEVRSAGPFPGAT
jgi:hypothetical protein